MSDLINWSNLVDAPLQGVFARRDGVTIRPGNEKARGIYVYEETEVVRDNYVIPAYTPTLIIRLEEWPIAPAEAMIIFVDEAGKEFQIIDIVDIEGGGRRLALKEY